MAMATNVTVIEQCQISPNPTSVSETSLPLSFIDMLMINSWPANCLYFYECSFSKSQFVDTIIPNLKNSFLQTLNHFFIVAGNLHIPPSDSDKKPEFVFKHGDSVSLTFSESTSVDLFHHLVANHPRNCSEFHCLATERPPPSVDDSGFTVLPLLTLQVTLFPGTGICIGLNAHHVVVDGNSVRAFLQAFAFFSQLNESSNSSLPVELMPIYDRSLMKETDECRDILWDQMKNNKKQEADNQEPAPTIAPMDNELVQTTFVVAKNDVQKLKNVIISSQSLPHLSTFTVICAYIWTCIAKTHATDEVVDPDEEDPEYLFAFSADARGRSKPSIPVNYFGNCVAFCGTNAKSSQLKGGGVGGFVLAAELIAKAIHERLQNDEGIFKDAETWIPSGKMFKRFVGVSGSPRTDYQGLDFGWGKAKKVEMVLNFESGVTFISAGKEPGDVDIGLCFSKEKMETFSTIFCDGLKEI